MKTARMIALALGLIVLAAAGEIASGREIANRIFGGTKVRPGEMPFMAAIFYNGPFGFQNGCGGSIIDESHILTAAHCFFDRDTSKLLEGLPGNIQVQVGCLNLTDCHSDRLNVSNIMIHHGYERTDSLLINDIAIIKLASAIELDGESTSIINLTGRENFCCDETLKTLTVAGWGEIEGVNYPDNLLKVNVDSIPLQECRKFNPQIDDKMICAGNKGRGPCFGDSGGPLIETDTSSSCNQVGVVSFGLDKGDVCGVNGTAYTKVAHYMDWIDACLVGNCSSLPL